MGAGCASSPKKIQLAPSPPSIGLGTFRQVMVSDYHGQLAGRAIGRVLAQALQEPVDPDLCVTILAVAEDGQVLAHATVFSGHVDRTITHRVGDARALLVEFLFNIHNWETPTLQISQGEGRTVLASAAFTRFLGDAEAESPPYRQSVSVVQGEPDLFVVVSGVPERAAERIVTSGTSSSIARRHLMHAASGH
ncbi:MAG: hypothetical protein PHI63_02740 [Patescibacteria group bacterium]|nr:hypothetical protein [Patescibacteria group bacterium]